MHNHSSEFAVSNFVSLEAQLERCLDYIPFITPNLTVVSPKFIPLILESCSLIDSIFSKLSGKDSERNNLKAYSMKFEEVLELDEKITLFLPTTLQPLCPFKGWTKSIPEWWDAYNKLKHDRLNNYQVASTANAVLSLAGLHQVMACNKDFIGPFLRVGWIDTRDTDAIDELGSVAGLGALHPSPPTTIVESKLFASPTRENFVRSFDGSYFDIDYESHGLSNRLRNLLFAHEEW